MDIGTIKTITLNGDSLECVVDFGADDVDPKCVLYCGANRQEYPLPGDEVVVDRSGAESVIIGVFIPISNLGSGESVLSGRDSDGVVISSVKVLNDGSVEVNRDKNGQLKVGTAGDPVATSWVVDNYFVVADAMFKAVDSLVGGIYTAQLSTAFPLTGGVIPSSASANVISDPDAEKPIPEVP